MSYQTLPVPGAADAVPEHLAEYSAEELRSFTYTSATDRRTQVRPAARSRRAGLLALYEDLCAELRAEAAASSAQHRQP